MTGYCYRIELRKNFGLYILNSFSPLPMIYNTFRPQSEDKLHRIDFIYNSFGENADCRHQNFKTFLAVQYNAIETPSINKYTNRKVINLLNYMNLLFPLIWILDIYFVIDEITIGFQCMHDDTRCMTYKNEGYGFQCDALCQDGFFYQF